MYFINYLFSLLSSFLGSLSGIPIVGDIAGALQNLIGYIV